MHVYIYLSNIRVGARTLSLHGGKFSGEFKTASQQGVSLSYQDVVLIVIWFALFEANIKMGINDELMLCGKQ